MYNARARQRVRGNFCLFKRRQNIENCMATIEVERITEAKLIITSNQNGSAAAAASICVLC